MEADGSQDALLVRVAVGGHVGWGECEAAPLPSIAARLLAETAPAPGPARSRRRTGTCELRPGCSIACPETADAGEAKVTLSCIVGAIPVGDN